MVLSSCYIGGFRQKGYNRHTSSCNPRNFKARRVCAIHAEIAACKNLHISKLRGATIYVVRVDNKGNLRDSRPCKACAKYLKRKGIKKIYHS